MIRFVLILLALAAAIYVFFWLVERRRHGGTGGQPAVRPPMGPDDDPEFLDRLEREWRREQRKKKKADNDHAE